jgi:carbon dioxide concentrating mechanism protein CcmN
MVDGNEQSTMDNGQSTVNHGKSSYQTNPSMYFPPLEPVSNSENYISGDVTIDASAFVAPGAILQAAPGSQIVIGAGACVGMGAILKAYHGAIKIKKGAILGAAVLVLGNSEIGDKACIGAATTIFNASVEAMAVIAAGSIIGDTSRQLREEPKEEPEGESILEPTEQEQQSEIPEPSPREIEAIPQPSVSENPAAATTPGEETPLEIELETEKETEPRSATATVIGKVYINQLLLTLFPQNQTSKRSPSKNND